MQKTLKKTQKGFTLIELLIVIAVIAILAAIAIPNLLSSRKAANESSAISSVRTLITAQETYRSRYGKYAAAIGDLGPAASGGTIGESSAGLIDGLLANGDKSGYTFTCAADTTNNTTEYSITAEPQTNAGERSFSADQTGVILSYASLTVTGTGSPIQ